MSLDRQLARWVGAGVIDGVTAERIRAHEQSGRRPLLLYALGGLGATTITIGLVSIVAANWDAIGAHTKLSADLALGLGLAIATAVVAGRGPSWSTEVLVLLYYGYTIASLALIGQVYQSHAPTHEALLVWSVATLPLVLLARTRWVATVVVAGWTWTHAATFAYAVTWLTSRLSASTHANLVITLAFVSPLAWLAVVRLPAMRHERPAWADVLARVALGALAAGGFAVTMGWYRELDPSDRPTWALATCLGGVVATFALAPPRFRRPLGGTVALAWVLLTVSLGLPHERFAAVGALLQIGWLAWLAFAALDVGRVPAFHALTGLVALRILAAYFEVFGSMLDTGLSMITGGALTLLMAWMWRKRSTAWADQWTGAPDA